MDKTTPLNSPSSAVMCSICLEDVSGDCDRTVVKLKCSHLFHLDCIGSAFNVKGAMECPNCRKIESGVWRCFENAGLGIDLFEGMDEEDDYMEYIGMGPRGTLVRRHHDWESLFASPDYYEDADRDSSVWPYNVVYPNHPNASHQRNLPQIDWRIDPFICDSCANVLSPDNHTGGTANWAPGATAAFTNETFGPQFLDQGLYDETAPIGFNYRGSNDPFDPDFLRVQQPPTISVSPAGLGSMRRSDEARGWPVAAEQSAPSYEQNPNSFSWSVNLNSSLSASAVAYAHYDVQETPLVEPLQLFPEDAGSFLPDMNL